MTEPEHSQADQDAVAEARADGAFPPSDLDLLLGDYTGTDEDAGRPEDETVLPPPDSERERLDVATTRDTQHAGPAPKALDAATRPPAHAATHSKPEKGPRTWMLWWIPVVCVPLLGGVAAWFALRRTHEGASRFMLGVGIGLGMLGSLAFLRYADLIAGYTAGPRETVIPAKTAPSPTR